VDPVFFDEGDVLVPSPYAVSPWSPDMVGGRNVTGLVAWAVERDHPPSGGLELARLTVDMFRVVPMRPLRVSTEVVRDGRRIRSVEASVWDGDVEVTRASAVLLARAEHPPAAAWTPEPWRSPEPEALPAIGDASTMSWDLRTLAPLGQGPNGAWMRELGPFVGADEASPLVRAALAADFVSALVNSDPQGLAFINTDVTMYLSRYPQGDWLGLEAVGHLGAQGVAVASAWLHDRSGRIGQTIAAALPDPRMRQR